MLKFGEIKNLLNIEKTKKQKCTIVTNFQLLNKSMRKQNTFSKFVL